MRQTTRNTASGNKEHCVGKRGTLRQTRNTASDNEEHCIRQQGTLHQTTGNTVSDNEEHCFRQRETLYQTMRNTVSENEEHCMRQPGKELLWKPDEIKATLLQLRPQCILFYLHAFYYRKGWVCGTLQWMKHDRQSDLYREQVDSLSTVGAFKLLLHFPSDQMWSEVMKI